MAMRSISHWGLFDVPEYEPGGVTWFDWLSGQPVMPDANRRQTALQGNIDAFLAGKPVTTERMSRDLRERLYD